MREVMDVDIRDCMGLSNDILVYMLGVSRWAIRVLEIVGGNWAKPSFVSWV